MALILIGAGGHARVVLDAARCSNIEIGGLLDSKLASGSRHSGATVLGGDEKLDDPGFVSAHIFHIALCDPGIKSRIVERLRTCGAKIVAIVHPSAVVSQEARIGDGAFINAGAIVMAAAELGACCVINTRASVDHESIVGACAHISPGAILCGDVTVGDGAVVGPGAVIGRGVHIGVRAVVGAGSVVLRDVAADECVAGAPAASIKPASSPGSR